MTFSISFDIIALWFITLNSSLFLANGLSCLHCQSKNESECLRQQVVTTCKSTQKSCITLSYDLIYNTPHGVVLDTVYRKKCVSGNLNCYWYCESRNTIGGNDCKAACCDFDGCNNGMAVSSIPYSSLAQKTACCYGIEIIAIISLILLLL